MHFTQFYLMQKVCKKCTWVLLAIIPQLMTPNCMHCPFHRGNWINIGVPLTTLSLRLD